MTTIAEPKPGAPAQSEESRQTMRDALAGMNKLADDAAAALSSGSAKVRTLDASGVHEKIENLTEDGRTAVLQKVAAFLNTSLRGPMFIGEAGGKIFVGRFPRRQDLLDVQCIVGNRPGEQLSVGQQNNFVISELRSSLMGWLPVKSPKAQLLRAHIDEPDEWNRLGINLNNVEWLASRDPYLFEREVEPLWEQYTAWKDSVTPSREEIDFYSSLMQ